MVMGDMDSKLYSPWERGGVFWLVSHTVGDKRWGLLARHKHNYAAYAKAKSTSIKSTA